jgi:hypothetical protein
MGRAVHLYEQAYNDLTAAVKRAKQACRTRTRKPSTTTTNSSKSTTLINASSAKQVRGRPKGSKDSIPRRKKSNAESLESLPLRSEEGIESESTEHSDSNKILHSGFDQSKSHGETAGFPPDTFLIDGHTVGDHPNVVNKDPACWELPLPC